MRQFFRAALAAAALAVGACTVSDAGDQRDSVSAAGPATATPPVSSTSDTAWTSAAAPGAPTPSAAPVATTPAAAPGATTPAAAAAPAGAPAPGMRLEVDVNARQLHVYDGARRVATHSVAVGSPKWPTQTGSWQVKQVVFNPEWIPPDESWAEEREPKKPGAANNPLGRAQLVYDPPRTIHGTNEPTTIGKNVSHGSIRLANEVIVPLARQVMEAGGVTKDDAWHRRVRERRTVKEVVTLTQPIPIRVF